MNPPNLINRLNKKRSEESCRRHEACSLTGGVCNKHKNSAVKNRKQDLPNVCERRKSRASLSYNSQHGLSRTKASTHSNTHTGGSVWVCVSVVGIGIGGAPSWPAEALKPLGELQATEDDQEGTDIGRRCLVDSRISWRREHWQCANRVRLIISKVNIMKNKLYSTPLLTLRHCFSQYRLSQRTGRILTATASLSQAGIWPYSITGTGEWMRFFAIFF